MMRENRIRLGVAECHIQYKGSNSNQRNHKQKSERGAILLEVIIASLFLLLVMSAGNRLLEFYHLNHRKLFISHQVLMQQQNER